MTVCQDDIFAFVLTLGHFFLAEYKVTGSRLWCVNVWDKALKESRLSSIKLLERRLNDAPSPGLSARLMEGTAFDCPLTDSCQPKPLSRNVELMMSASLRQGRLTHRRLNQLALAQWWMHALILSFGNKHRLRDKSTHQAETTVTLLFWKRYQCY